MFAHIPLPTWVGWHGIDLFDIGQNGKLIEHLLRIDRIVFKHLVLYLPPPSSAPPSVLKFWFLVAAIRHVIYRNLFYFMLIVFFDITYFLGGGGAVWCCCWWWWLLRTVSVWYTSHLWITTHHSGGTFYVLCYKMYGRRRGARVAPVQFVVVAVFVWYEIVYICVACTR